MLLPEPRRVLSSGLRPQDESTSRENEGCALPSPANEAIPQPLQGQQARNASKVRGPTNHKHSAASEATSLKSNRCWTSEVLALFKLGLQPRAGIDMQRVLTSKDWVRTPGDPAHQHISACDLIPQLPVLCPDPRVLPSWS